MSFLTWESALTDEPRDQNADSRASAHAFFSLGPAGDGWVLALIERDDTLTEVGYTPLGSYPSETAAKEAAAEYEARVLNND